MYLQGLVLSVNECLFLPSARHQCTKSAYLYTPIKKARQATGVERDERANIHRRPIRLHVSHAKEV
jgi:hypothetical protein